MSDFVARDLAFIGEYLRLRYDISVIQGQVLGLPKIDIYHDQSVEAQIMVEDGGLVLRAGQWYAGDFYFREKTLEMLDTLVALDFIGHFGVVDYRSGLFGVRSQISISAEARARVILRKRVLAVSPPWCSTALSRLQALERLSVDFPIASDVIRALRDATNLDEAKPKYMSSTWGGALDK